jgi:hypothetical protein
VIPPRKKSKIDRLKIEAQEDTPEMLSRLKPGISFPARSNAVRWEIVK